MMEEIKHKRWIYKPSLREQIVTEARRLPTIMNPETLTNSLQTICQKALAPTKPRNRSQGKPWWSQRLKELRTRLLACRRILTRANKETQGNPNNDILTSFKIAYTEFTIEKKASKNRLHERLCEEINRNPWGDAYRTAMSALKPRARCIVPKNLDKILDGLFPKHPKLKPISYPQDPPHEVSELEITTAAKKLKSGKSPGPDGIPAEVVQINALTNTAKMAKMMTDILQTGVFPTQWKSATLKLLPKEGNSDLTPKYRPICLINATAKLLEHVVNARLLEELTKNDGISTKQHAFTRNRSCLTALDEALRAMDKVKKRGPGWVASIILLDVKNAFNSANWLKILQTLESLKVNHYLLKIIQSYFQDRTLHIDDKTYVLTSGVPQGSVLGPTLWNVLINSVTKVELPDNCDMILYADDIALIIGAKDGKSMSHKGNLALKRIQATLNGLGLELAADKTNALIAHGKRTSIPKDTAFCLNGITIRPGKEVKYLGITLDEDLNFRKHAERTCLKATRALNALAAILSAKTAKMARRRVIARVIEGQLLYGCEVWMSRMASQALNDMEVIQKRAAVRIVRGFPSMSGEAALVLAGMVPLTIQAKQRQEKFQGCKQQDKEDSMKAWQTRWERAEAAWTRNLIPQIKRWTTRTHGELTSELTQILSGHGNFGTFLKMTKRKSCNLCPYCNTQETVRHQTMFCPRFDKERTTAGLQAETDPRKIVTKMLTSSEAWNSVEQLARTICEAGKP